MTRTKKDAISKGFNLPTPPLHTAVPEDVAQRFEQPALVVVAEPSEPASPPEHLAISRHRAAKQGERLSVYIPPKLAEKLRVRCARERRTLSDAVTDALSAWLQS